MASSLNFYSVLVLVLVLFMLSVSSFVSSSSTCLPRINTVVLDLKLQCPLTISPRWPIEMDGESLGRLLSSSRRNGYVAILFYASWCPFSMDVQPKFAALSSMYPHIEHVMVKQSLALPTVFSRHGIHGVPSILVVNTTSRARYRGPKDLNSLLHFYQQATGLDPVAYMTEDEISSSKSTPTVHQSWTRTSLKDIVANEPYLASSLLFIFLKIFLYIFPNTISHMIALWVAHIPHLNLAIFGKSRQVLARRLHLLDLKRAFSKLKFWKNRNFHEQQNWFPLFIGKSRGR